MATQTLIIEPDQGLTSIYNLIQSAKTSIDMTMYELVDTQAQALLDQAAASGIKVRVILDQNLEHSNNLAAYNDLQSHGVLVVWAPIKYAATHQKMRRHRWHHGGSDDAQPHQSLLQQQSRLRGDRE